MIVNIGAFFYARNLGTKLSVHAALDSWFSHESFSFQGTDKFLF